MVAQLTDPSREGPRAETGILGGTLLLFYQLEHSEKVPKFAIAYKNLQKQVETEPHTPVSAPERQVIPC